jgi:hypothetical protein
MGLETKLSLLPLRLLASGEYKVRNFDIQGVETLYFSQKHDMTTFSFSSPR